MKILDFRTGDFEIDQILNRDTGFNRDIINVVEKIILDVEDRGDDALLDLSNKFDGANFDTLQDFLVSQNEIDEALNNIDDDVFAALKNAYQRIYFYHKKQMPSDFIYNDEEGLELGNLWRSIKKVGVYAPGGTASYPSSVLMSAVPAIVAGACEIVLCAPTSNGKMSDAVLVAAKICGIKKIYKIGGAQAIAAMARGTNLVEKVDKIVGPGNSYVALAKKIFYGEVGIDMIAGPTDLTIICDDSCDVDFVVSDVLSQLEHGGDSQVFVICDNYDFAANILARINEIAPELSRFGIIKESLKKSFIIVVEDLDEACEIANKIAPEHLEIATKDAKKYIAKIENAGAIFVGKYAPESIGDYIAGPSHVLPTSGTARFSSGLSVYDFLKRISLISCDESAFLKVAKDASLLAESEGLSAHKLSVEIRKK